MKIKEKEMACQLRQCGESIKQIAKKLDVSVSSVSFWVREIKLTDKQQQSLNNRQVASRWSVAEKSRDNATKRHALFKMAGYKLAKESEDFRLISALYWGEGGKSHRTKIFRLSNSDESMIRKVFGWLKSKNYAVTLRVAYYEENGLNESEIKQWWLDKMPKLDFIQLSKSKISS